jgi:5-methylcytosine-specific restriction protein A
MKITTEMTRSAYATSKDVYEGRTDLGEALDYLEADCGMNRGSANDYIQGFKKMMNGERYTRTFNTEATEYYFTNIRQDYGLAALRNALQAAIAHVEYYEDLGRGNLNSIRDVIAAHRILLRIEEPIYPDELDEPELLLEGQKKKVFVNAYERNPKARAKCVEHYGATCSVCEMNFGEVYGELGEGFIHGHHLLPVAQLGKQYEVDPVTDLRQVCPNCHAMLHRRNPPLSINELKETTHNKAFQPTPKARGLYPLRQPRRTSFR